MASTKSALFTAQQNRLAKMAKALGHPARIAILEHLIRSQSCICGEIVEELPLSQATISQHLKALKNAGIISGNEKGTSVCYCINVEGWAELKSGLSGLFASLKNCC